MITHGGGGINARHLFCATPEPLVIASLCRLHESSALPPVHPAVITFLLGVLALDDLLPAVFTECFFALLLDKRIYVFNGIFAESCFDLCPFILSILCYRLRKIDNM